MRAHVMPDRIAYWNDFSKASRSLGQRLLFERNYTKSLVLEPADFEKIRAATLPIVSRSLVAQLGVEATEVATLEDALIAVNRTRALKVSRDWDELTRLEAALTAALRKIGALEGIEGIEFPINVRVAHGAAPEGYLERDYATDHLHTDVWADEPGDIVQGLIYIGGDLNATFMELFDCPLFGTEAIANYRGPYNGGNELITHCEKVPYQPREGQLILFDGICPHRTIRAGGGARISIDFRLRRNDPYAVLDERWGRERAPWAKYWSVGGANCTRFADRSQIELDRLRERKNTAALEARKAWIAKLLG